MNAIATRSVAIDIQEKGGGFTARCHSLGLVAHAGDVERALRQLKEQVDRRCPGVRVHLAENAVLYTRTALRSGYRRGVVDAISTPINSATSLRPSQQ